MGMCKFELLLILLLILTGAFLVMPLINTFTQQKNSPDPISPNESHSEWNSGLDNNLSEFPVKVLGKD
jgi:hypothetical protein